MRMRGRIAELDRLLGDREGAPRSAPATRSPWRTVARTDQRHQRPGSAPSGRTGSRPPPGCCSSMRALAEVVQHQRRHHQAEPGDADRPLAEVAHVGIERLAAGDAQHDRAQRDEGDAAVARAGSSARSAGSAPPASPGSATMCGRPEHREHDEPQHHHRAEEAADARRCRGAARGTAPSARPASAARRSCVQRGRGDLQALDRRQHRDRRRDHAVAEEDRGAEDAQQQQARGAASGGPRTAVEASASIAIRPPSPLLSARRISTHVLDRDDDGQRPEHQRQHAVDVVRSSSGDVAVREALPSAHTAGWCRCRRRRRRQRPA